MPGYVIHLAVAKKQIENFQIKNSNEFIKGTIAPDLLKKKGINSHYGNSSNPNIKEFLKNTKINDDYNKGYLLHLVTDYLFYNKFLAKWSPEIYNDYDILNKKLIEKYEINLPEEVKKYVNLNDGNLTILNLDDIITFIETVGKLPLEQICNEYRGEDENECQK